MKITDRLIGVWGYGRVGQAIAHFLQSQGRHVMVYDRAVATAYYNTATGIQFHPEHEIHNNTCDCIIPSPGIDINQHPNLQSQCIAEYDAFYEHSTIPHIGITGSLGKTTITALIAQTLQTAHIPADVGGNIGVPLFSLLNSDIHTQHHVVELSSFQLEHIQRAAPDVAVLTNFYPNHLDRHVTIDAYLHAKCNIFRYQNSDQHALLPITMRNTYGMIHPHRRCCVFAPSYAVYNLYKHELHDTDIVYVLDNSTIYRITDHTQYLTHVPHDITFDINWLIVTAVCDILGYATPYNINHDTTYKEHRREYLGMRHGVHWYNDSKATIMPATCAAVESLRSTHRIILLLGGTSKGVDRTPYIQQLAHGVRHVVCWGDEAYTLLQICQQCGISACMSTTLEHATQHAYNMSGYADAILLSPGGASFDQFSSYQERGAAFKNIVTNI